MKLTHRLALTVAACGLATSAFAQDSVSPNGALPGDALEVYDASESCNAYVIDAVDFTASWGTPLRMAPVLKSPRMTGSTFFNNLISGHAISHDLTSAASYPAASYQVWNAPGFGINDQVNLVPGTTSPGGSSLQFGVTLADFGLSGGGNSYNGSHSAVVNVDPADDSRLYVYRVSTAVNGFNGSENRSQFGMGVIDADGNVHFRADDDRGSAIGPNPITGQNIFRTRILDRACAVLNVIDNAGGTDASEWLVANSGATHIVPNALPESLAGRPVYGGVNFDGQYGYESSPGTVVYTASHTQGAASSRGSNGASIAPWFGGANAVAAYALMAKTVGADADSISVWDVDANGNVVNPGALITVPCAPGQGGSITDNNDGFAISGWELDGYHSQTSFRGGTGSAALTVTPAGERLVASTAYDTRVGGNDNPSNAIVVGKHDTATGATVWTLGGYYDVPSATGKAIKDGPGGTVIGVMTGMFNVTGGAPFGPSMSQPAFDCAGNVYFVAAVELFGEFGSDFDVALVRGVYDAATFSYELELLATSGDTYAGNNSGTPYSITFVDLADFDSISSGTFYASNVMNACWAGTAQGDLDGSRDPRAVGGVVLNARITYDTDGNGMFENDFDENYRALLLITGTGAASNPCDYADFNGDGSVNTQDFLAFLGDWAAGDLAADCNGDGSINTLDFICFLTQWAECR